MKFRWLIRSFAIALLTLCLNVLAWSYFYQFCTWYGPSHDKHYSVGTYMGGVGFGVVTHGSLPKGWSFSYDRPAHSLSDITDIRFLGFVYFDWALDPTRSGLATGRGFCIPFWFLSLLSAGLLWFVWRRTRTKTAGRGFPVEVTQSK